MYDTESIEGIRWKYESLSSMMDERMRRQWAASEASALGHGGVAAVMRATGLARNTIKAGQRELQYREENPDEPVPARVRRPGAGRPKAVDVDPELVQTLESLVDPVTRGDPMSPLRWTCKSTARLAEELRKCNHAVSPRTVARLLKEAGYSLQANRKTREGKQHPDRNAQFEHINDQVVRFGRQRQPVISVDTKKKELVGDFRNPGAEWQPKGQPETVRVHDFKDPELGKAIPYGVYDLANNEGWVTVGITHDTARFAVASIRRWWIEMGQARFPRAGKLMVTADGGGSNSSRNRLWKVELQGLANDTGLAIHVCHFPPGTSKWNKVEHRLFCFITKNWRGRPLESVQAIVELIAHTTTKAGLIVRAALDDNEYETGIKISDAQLAAVNLHRSEFHGDWNYTIKPHRQK
jgi:transposase